jgi:ribokinase
MAGESVLFTALGDDELASRSRDRFAELGVKVEAATRPGPTRRAVTFLDAHGERTITTIGERLEPRGEDGLDWAWLDGADGVYLTAGDESALQAARGARVLVASPRAGRVLAESSVRLDALVYSENDEFEATLARALEPRPGILVATRGAEGGTWEDADGDTGTWEAAPLPGPIVDTYGAGDSFAAAFTYGLAQGEEIDQALTLAAEAAALNMTRQGPYG